ncbi:Serine/threonine-protein kinase VRK1 [Willisornis vidua]|uniref:non-specific serine/threonine protein kinase n=1 Tax=Willisornis vidua TaxID=1566151 RepID=A0ABQ9CY63_9PASS|nr:Serine/threonine-protein kinase VRK1 [Willisornis vidua]
MQLRTGTVYVEHHSGTSVELRKIHEMYQILFNLLPINNPETTKWYLASFWRISEVQHYRFMIIDRFGRDLQKIYEENEKRFSHKTVLQLGLRILDILEFVHEHEYVHGDIKAANLLLSYKNPNQVYLVDYGLAYRYCSEGVHKAYKEDPKRCHDGTIEYTSIDAHKGVAPSRRGDLEILGYCMIHWLSGHLPWEDNLKDPNFVRDSKIRCRDNISILMDKCFPGKNKPDEIAKYMEKVKLLSYEEKPVYQHFQEILLQGLKAIGQKDDGVLDFGLTENGDFQTNTVPKKRRKAAAAASESTETEMDDTGCPEKKKAATSSTTNKSGLALAYSGFGASWKGLC